MNVCTIVQIQTINDLNILNSTHSARIGDRFMNFLTKTALMKKMRVCLQEMNACVILLGDS